MKKTAFIIIVLGLLLSASNFADSNFALAGESFESTNSAVSEETLFNAQQEPQKAEVEEAKTEKTAEAEKDAKPRKKFFSILERNKDTAKEEDGESVKFNSEKAAATETNVDEEGPTTNVLVDSDMIEYFPDRHEFEALGHAKVTFTSQGSTLTADKIIFNHDSNYIKAYDNVTLIKEGQKVLGDYMQVNLNDENALITDPVLNHLNIKVRAKVANVNNTKTEAMDGTAVFTDKSMFKFVSRSVFGFDKPPIDDEESKDYFIKEKFNNEWKLKSDLIIIDSYKDRDIVTLKKSDIYLKDLKVGSTGTFKIYTDKEQNYVETNMIEFGSMRNMGMFLSPGYVFQMPKASTLKIGPAVGYSSGFGAGGIGRFMNAYNRTDFGYLSSKSKVVIRGKHQFNEKLWAQYGLNSYLDEWWMGGRLPKYGAQLVYGVPYKNEDLKLNFESRFSAGLAQDWDRSFATTRFRWQTQTMKEIYEYKNSDKKFAASFGLGVQSTASIYGTGDTYGVIRVGPHFRTQYKGWQQYLAYYAGGEAGESPFMFDRLFYSKSSIQLGESIRINKYLTFMYSATLALAETPNDEMLQENRFYLAIGPDDFRVLLGYDAYRKNTTFGINMAIGSENSELEFKRLILNEPTNVGQSNGKKKKKSGVKNVNNENAYQERREYGQMNPNQNGPNYSILNNMISPGLRPQGY